MGNLLTDPATADELKTLLVKANHSVDETQVTLNNLQQASTNLPGISDAVGKEAKDLPGLVMQTQVSMREIERLVEAMQRTWLLRKYVNQTNPPPLRPLPEPAVPEKKPGRCSFAEGFCELRFQAESVFAGHSQSTVGLHPIADTLQVMLFALKKTSMTKPENSPRVKLVFFKKHFTACSRTQGSHLKSKVAKAGQHFFQIP